MNNQINQYCVNSFLNFRYVVDNKQVWADGWKPWWPDSISHNQKSVDNEEDVISFTTCCGSTICS